jgi:hypothetical protein
MKYFSFTLKRKVTTEGRRGRKKKGAEQVGRQSRDGGREEREEEGSWQEDSRGGNEGRKFRPGEEGGGGRRRGKEGEGNPKNIFNLF